MQYLPMRHQVLLTWAGEREKARLAFGSVCGYFGLAIPERKVWHAENLAVTVALCTRSTQ